MLSNFDISLLADPRNIMFLILAMLTIGGAIFMINLTRVVHMVVSLAVTFLSLAGLYVLLNAEFVAFVQVLIYAGAISILMIFGIMMTKHQNEEEAPRRPWHNGLLLVGALMLFGFIFYAVQTADFPTGQVLNDEGQDNTMEIGKMLFNIHVIPFELMSVLLTVALIGAIVVAKREEE